MNPCDQDSTDLYGVDTTEIVDNSIKEVDVQLVNIDQKQ